MNKKILEMIEEYGEEKAFFGAVSEEDICNAEKILSVTFPENYREFVKNYGSGGICGVHLTGIQGNLAATVVEATEKYRRLGMDAKLIVVEDVDEFARCMYSGDDGRVFVWYRGNKELHFRYETFDEYLIDMFQEGIDNL